MFGFSRTRATPHTAWISINVLRQLFPGRLIEQSDLTPCDLWWGGGGLLEEGGGVTSP